MELDQDKLQAAIVTAAVNQLLGTEDFDGIVKKAIESRIDRLFAERVSAQINAAIDRAIEEGFEREYRPVNSFGTPVGTATTIRRELEQSITGYWTTRVDQNGKPTTDTYGDPLTRAEWLMTKAVGEDFAKMVRQNAVNVTGGLKDAMRGELRKNLDVVLGELFRVTSAQDKEEGRKR